MKPFLIAAICCISVAAVEPAMAYPYSTTCSNIGPITHCSSGNSRGFNGQLYNLGGTTYLNGYDNGQRVSCQSYQLGYSTRTTCQ